ncbi:MAG TPA: hypothetical protein PLG90_10315 [Ignavibacteria bacterium]|nr:hypothetical protein [Ignavibacteria bacterium]
MSKIDIDKVKKTFNWDPSKGDYLVRPEEERKKSIKNYIGIIAIAISVIMVFFIISYIKFM